MEDDGADDLHGEGLFAQGAPGGLPIDRKGVGALRKEWIHKMSFLERIFGSYSKKELARLEPIKQKVLDLEPKYQAMDPVRLSFFRMDPVAFPSCPFSS